ncbi:GatB/YqeY domain-containing protein [Candidatus Parcubacteria bacterium]|nr:GatB/YqeY domain-containing protein [Candidatus Parcubacteria bacterium]
MLLEKLNQELKQAMKDKDTQKLSVLRMLVSAFNNEAISLKKKDKGLNAEEELKILKKEVKKHKDSIQQYEAGNRPELAEQEKKELEILNVYLPEEMSENEIRKIIQEVISEIGEVAPSQFGQIMGQVMAKIKGQADGNVVSKVVKEEIN